MVNVPAAVVVVVAVVLVVGLFVLIVRLAAARDLAARRGHEPGEAAAVTLLGGGAGLAATYLKPRGDGHGGEPSASTLRAERLEELESLRQRHLITDEEAAARRAEIIAEL